MLPIGSTPHTRQSLLAGLCRISNPAAPCRNRHRTVTWKRNYTCTGSLFLEAESVQPSVPSRNIDLSAGYHRLTEMSPAID